ncbi:3-methyladenine DNA glycosylase, partial [Pseudomonas ogarae]
MNAADSAPGLEAPLPVSKALAQLRQISADRYLSTKALRVFRAGLQH